MSKSATCPECHKVFTHRKNLYQHQRNIHGTEPDLLEYPKNFTCDTCGICFTFLQNLYRHKKKIHQAKLCLGPIKHECSLCGLSFRTQHTYLRHLHMTHNENFQSFLFSSKREFEVWKCEEEDKCKALFSVRSCYRVFGNARRTVFLCHRYGQFKSKSSGRRCLKVLGSTREGNHCTARMEVTEFQNGEVRVVYFSRHQLHLDSVDYTVRKDKAAEYISDDNCSFSLEKVPPIRKPRIRLSDIREIHSLAEKMSPDLVITDRQRKINDTTVTFVTSEKTSDKIYRVTSTGNSCYPGRPHKKCNLVCRNCNVCIHDYKCSCDNWAKFGGLMCKHIHLVGLEKMKHNNSIEESTDIWESEGNCFDDSIFVEIEVDSEDCCETHGAFSESDPSCGVDIPDDEIQLSTFESLHNLGKNAAVSELESDIIRKVNSTAQEYLYVLQSILRQTNISNLVSNSPHPQKKVKVESIFEL